MSQKRRQSSQKREREQKKRDRQREKAEQAARKAELRDSQDSKGPSDGASAEGLPVGDGDQAEAHN